MKMKSFILIVLFLGIGMMSYAQSQSEAPAAKKDAPAIEHSKATGAKAECKWVDANNDGKCDACGMTASECKEKCAPAPKKSGCASTCPMSKSCGENKAVAEPKDGRKPE